MISAIGLLFTYKQLANIEWQGLDVIGYKSIYHSIPFQTDELKEIDLKNADGRIQVTFAPSTDGKNYVVIDGILQKSVAEQIEQSQMMNQKLTLDFEKRDKRKNIFDAHFQIGFIHFYNSLPEVSVTCYLANTTTIEKLSIENQAADTYLTHVHVNELTINQDVGDLILTDVQANNTTVRINTGDVSGSNIIGRLDVGTNVGDVKLTQTLVYPISVDTNIGDVFIRQATDFKGSYVLKTRIGDISAPTERRETQDVILVTVDVGDITIK